jgi:hypothetical protein
MSISIISSLYRVEAHLPQFTASVQRFAEAVHQAGVDVRYIPIVNDATEAERTAIDQLAHRINTAGHGSMSPQYVGRETLYASWNRGVRAGDTPYFSFWNADDVRDPEAFIEGYRALQDGATLVDYIFNVRRIVKRLGVFTSQREEHSRMLFHPEPFTRKNGVGPFFMASRDLYDQIGAFDENFRVTGDMEWAERSLPVVKFYAAKRVGGHFYIHGGNLSNTGTSREDIEVNIIFMRIGEWYQLIPVNPVAMREAWDTWGNRDGVILPDDVQDFLWGDEADARWRQYQAERNQPSWIQAMRRRLASRGLIRSAEWDVFLRNSGR